MHPSASTISLCNSNPRLSSSVERHDLSNFHDRQRVWPLSSAKKQFYQGLPNVYRALASNSTDSSFHLDKQRSRCRRNLAIFTGIRFNSRFVCNLYFSWNLKNTRVQKKGKKRKRVSRENRVCERLPSQRVEEDSRIREVTRKRGRKVGEKVKPIYPLTETGFLRIHVGFPLRSTERRIAPISSTLSHRERD